MKKILDEWMIRGGDWRGGGLRGVSTNGKTHPVICVFVSLPVKIERFFLGRALWKRMSEFEGCGGRVKIAKEIEAIYFRSWFKRMSIFYLLYSPHFYVANLLSMWMWHDLMPQIKYTEGWNFFKWLRIKLLSNGISYWISISSWVLLEDMTEI